MTKVKRSHRELKSRHETQVKRHRQHAANISRGERPPVFLPTYLTPSILLVEAKAERKKIVAKILVLSTLTEIPDPSMPGEQ